MPYIKALAKSIKIYDKENFAVLHHKLHLTLKDRFGIQIHDLANKIYCAKLYKKKNFLLLRM